ncbi:hypothetical protein [Thiolapillus brandeum]|uniref:Response regulator n=1 Tax=Thiolapillus brandeum TaxID=1076588 RepID=A0A7U6GKN7_9GAMM|nr:hypothetical protein [Thiolapillus brandeum]BAO45379.1 conserved hypothetical protein [Thiolapillus brandeum]
MSLEKSLLAIVELGGYPNFMPLYQQLGFAVELVTSQRKARMALKKKQPDVVVAEYNYQTDFRDRSSNLETLAAVLQQYPEVKLLVFYPPQHQAFFEKFREHHRVWKAIPFPVTEEMVVEALEKL